MGNMQATAYAEAVDEGLSLDTALTAHLGSNHFPPVHPVFVPVAKAAIEAARDEEYETEIDLPNGITLTAGEIVDQLHLSAFL